MKVLLVHPPMYPVNHKFYNLLAEKVDLTVFQIGSHPEFHTSWTSENIRKDKVNYKLQIFSEGKVTLLKTLNPKVLTELKKAKPDIVLSIAFWMPSLILSLIKVIFNYKFVILTNAIVETEKTTSIIKNKLRKIIVNNTDMFISASNLTTEYLQKKLNVNNITLSIQTSDIDGWKDSFDNIKSKKILRQKLNINQDKKVMLGLGNFIEKKNWKNVLRSLKNIENILFILIGSGKEKNDYKEIIEKNNIQEKVLILGRKEGENLLEYFKVSDFLIFPSLYDQYGFVTPEALSVGLPVICTKNAGSECLIKDGENGYLMNPNKNCDEIIIKTINNLEILKTNVQREPYNLSLKDRVNEFKIIFNNLYLDKK